MSKIVFRFKITFEDTLDVERIIDVSGTNTFNDFHLAIQDAIGFDRIKQASFYKANDLWRGGEEFSTEPKGHAKAATDAILSKHIDDPYQRFLYNYDPEEGDWHLRAEVMRLIRGEEGKEYPFLVKSVGVSPKQYIKLSDVITDPSEKLFKEADGIIKDLGTLLTLDEDDEDEDEDEEDDKGGDDFNLYGEEVDESEL
jgi:hypothetical protein